MLAFSRKKKYFNRSIYIFIIKFEVFFFFLFQLAKQSFCCSRWFWSVSRHMHRTACHFASPRRKRITCQHIWLSQGSYVEVARPDFHKLGTWRSVTRGSVCQGLTCSPGDRNCCFKNKKNGRKQPPGGRITWQVTHSLLNWQGIAGIKSLQKLC